MWQCSRRITISRKFIQSESKLANHTIKHEKTVRCCLLAQGENNSRIFFLDKKFFLEIFERLKPENEPSDQHWGEGGSELLMGTKIFFKKLHDIVLITQGNKNLRI